MKTWIVFAIFACILLHSIGAVNNKAYSYNVTIKFGYEFDQESGKLKAIFEGPSYHEQRALSPTKETFTSGSSKSYLITLTEEIDSIKSIKLLFKAKSFFSKPSIYVQRITLTPAYMSESEAQNRTRNFCPTNLSTKLKSKRWTQFSIKCQSN